MFSLPDEIIAGCIEEVAGYVPSLKKEIEALGDENRRAGAVASLLEQAATIKGATSLMNLSVLQQMAAEIEATLQQTADSTDIPEEIVSALGETVADLSRYCTDIRKEGVDSRELLRAVIMRHRALKEDPPDAEASMESLLAGIPDHEKIEVSEEEPISEEPELEETPALPEETPPPPPPSPSLPAAAIPKELLESYYEEADEHLEDLDRALNQLELNITDEVALSSENREIIRGIRRSVHTIKGAAAVIGLHSIAEWGHIMEDFLDWLFEKARTATPAIVALLRESEDLLAHIVAHPDDPRKDQADAISRQYSAIIGSAPKSQETKPQPAPAPPPADDDVPPASEIAAHASQTLRVSTERVDELVNLIGEIMITSGAFEQHLNRMTVAQNELETVRDHFREIAKKMEIGYEVKALSRLMSPEKTGESGAVLPMPEQPPSFPGDAEPFHEFDDLELDRYSQLNLIIRTLNESVVESGGVNNRITSYYSDFEGILNRQRILLRELQEKMMHLRMLPMNTITNRLFRTVREISKMLNKKTRLSIAGEGIELDRVIWKKLSDPLMHLIRNAIDHGVESPEKRKAVGKPPIATLHLSAAREGNQVMIQLSDDGAGLDYSAIFQKAVKNGLADPSESLSDKALAGLIFTPGFSTCNTISQVSGRGVGMDVVRENIQALKGTIRVHSVPGKGTRFSIRIPLTLAALRALLFSVAGQVYAIALTEVREILRADPDRIIHKPHPAVRMEDELVPLYQLREMLPSTSSASPADSHFILVVETGGKRRALKVDALIGQQEIVIKSTGSHLRYVKGIAGAAIIGDGSVAPILNIPELIGEEVGVAESKDEKHAEAFETVPSLTVMVVDDSVSIRKVVTDLIEDQGWVAMAAKNGQDALDQLAQKQPDLIILDVEMPQMNGFEFLAARAERLEYRRIPVIMLTSRSTAKHREKALSLGASGFIGKPFQRELFIEEILRLSQQGGAKS